MNAANDAKRDRIRAAIEADPTATNTAIAKALHVARDTVIEVRRIMNKGDSIMSEADPTQDIDVFTLPVHPWAARFPMRTDDDLDAMAESIKAHGLRMPVVLGMAVTAEGFPPRLCVIDGRNRIAACKRAGVTPHTVTLNGEDQDAFIADANLERRDLTKGQKAMLVAVRFPVSKTHRGKQSDAALDSVSKSISGARVSQARAVFAMCPEMVDAVIEGRTGLDEAYQEAKMRSAAKQSTESRFATLQMMEPDLADLVTEERMSIGEAEAAARMREEERANRLRSNVNLVEEISRRAHTIGDPLISEIVSAYSAKPDAFHTDDLRRDVDGWIETLENLREALNESQTKG